jgi:DNA-binding Xre family transcriptional regulator
MRLISHVARAIRRSGRNTTEFAREAGIARSTLEKLIGNHFREIRRDTIERLAARLGIDDITELFTLQRDELEFLAPFATRKSVTFVFGTHDVVTPPDGIERTSGALRTTIDLWDFRTQSEFLGFLRRHVPDVRDEMVCFSKQSFGEQEQQQVLELIRSHNVVIVGSPKVNPACETALCALYRGGLRTSRRGATASTAGPALRLAEDKRMRGSILSASGFEKTGVADVKKNKLVAHSELLGSGQESLDAGVLFVAHRPLGTPEEVSLAIAAGISGCGTYGALRSLIDSPPEGAELKPGVVLERAVQTVYRKPTDSLRDDRQVVRVTRA